jgi:hypothetical protein
MASPRNKPWADRIKRLMAEAGVEIQDLVDGKVAARATVYSWTIGTRIPSRGLQPKLARKLGVSVAELNGWSE